MGRVQFMSTAEAAQLILNDAYIGTVGFLLIGAAEEIWIEVEKRFLQAGEPRNLKLMWASGIGDGGTERGLNHLCHEGLLQRLVGGHYALFPKVAPLINENKVAAYNFPQGVLCQLYREMAARRPGVLTHVGLGTFADPDVDGGKLNTAAQEELVEKLQIKGKDYLLYHSQPIDIAVIRGTEADEDGNISLRKEALTLEHLACAMAAHNNGGKVIVQVERVVKRGTIPPKEVVIPGIVVDVVAVVQDRKNHMQTGGTVYNEDFISSNAIYALEQKDVPLNIKKIIARRSAMEVQSDYVVLNYGIGTPEIIAEVLKEEGLSHLFTSSVEPGVIGGLARNGMDFGTALGPQAIIDEPYQFDFYDGGGVDCTFLGMAECDRRGNLNVSKFGPKIAGCGGFIDISQNAKRCVFCGTFTAGGLKVHTEDGRLVIDQEGKVKKFIHEVEQITLNGQLEGQKGKKITLVTERAVFELRPEGLVLTEIAPGISLERDILVQMDFTPLIAADLKEMDRRIFRDELMGLGIVI